MGSRQEARYSPPKQLVLNGFWAWDIRQNRIYGCANLIDYFGFTIDAAARGLAIADYTDRIDRSDRQRVNDAIARAVAERVPFRETYLVHTRTRGPRRILAQGRCYYDEFDEPASFPGWFVDVTNAGASDEDPLLVCRRFTELARSAAARTGNDVLCYLLEMALMEAHDRILTAHQSSSSEH